MKSFLSNQSSTATVTSVPPLTATSIKAAANSSTNHSSSLPADAKQHSRICRYNQIWQNYKESRRCDYVTRTGFYRFHINKTIDQVLIDLSASGFTDNQLNVIAAELAKIDASSTNRAESVSEHSLGALELAIGISRHFPSVIHPYELMRFVRILKYHDIPEKEIGDIPDDGDRDENKKNYHELAVMKNFVKDWPETERRAFLHDYNLFQHPLEPHAEIRDQRFAATAYLCDKLDAILKSLVYESNSHLGYCSQSLASSRDQSSINFTGTDNIVDGWSWQFLHRILPKAPIVNELFFGILKSAVLDVRGEWFPWAKDYKL